MRRLAARRATTLLTLLLELTFLPLLPLLAAPAAADDAANELPLAVSIESVTPSALTGTLAGEARRRVVVTGRVTNRSEETWRDLSVYLVSSAAPLRTRDELAAAVQSSAEDSVGERIVDDGLYDEPGDLRPGGTTAYRLSVPRSALPVSAAGVYWLAVQVLASSPDGARDGVADGRARTFIPLMADDGPSTTLALGVQFRAPNARSADGRLFDPARWAREVSPTGRMRRLLDQARRSGPVQTTWLLDPAVLDSIRSVAAGDPPLDLSPTTTGAGQGNPGATAEPTPEEDQSGGDTGGTGQGGQEGGQAGTAGQAVPTAAMRAARTWLQRFERSLPGRAVATVPYGDVDVAAALRTGHDRMLAGAVQRSADEADRLGVVATPVVAPPLGRLPSEALTFLPPGARVVLRRDALEGVEAARADLRTGATVALTGADLVSGGPSPAPHWTALAMRQRILAEAAVHALGPHADQPLVLLLPPQWNPGPRWRRAGFFRGMRLPWVSTTSLAAVFAAPAQAAPVAPSSTVYSDAEQRTELPVQNFTAVRSMINAGDTLAGLLTFNDAVDEQVERHALLSTSVWMRRTPLRARLRAEAGARDVRRLLGRVRLRTQSFVTMSSDTGSFQVTLINGLDQVVTAGVRAAVADRRLTVEAPPPVRVPPGERRTIRVEVRATDIGVHRVAVVPVNADGIPTGPRTTFDVRSSNVGLIIWVIMGAGLAVLLVAVVVRVTRRVRRRRATPGPLLDRDPVGHR